jgi:hypothetical protein
MDRSTSRVAGTIAIALLLAILLGWWGWCFLGELFLIAHSGVEGARSVNPVVRDFLTHGLHRPLMALHIGLVGGLAAVVLLLKHGDPAQSIARVLAALHGVALLIIAFLWFPLVRWMLTTWSGVPAHVAIVNFAWWGAACVSAFLYCRYRSPIIPWALLMTAAACMAGAFYLVVWSSVGLGMKLPKGLHPWGFAAAMCLLAACAVVAVLARAKHGETTLWLMAAPATIVQTWVLCCLAPFYLLINQIPASSQYWLNLPLHAGFVAAEVIMAYVIWKRWRRLFDFEELAGGFPVITKSEDAPA